jgi:hypothetical protein
MGYKRHFGSLANHESKFHPLPAIGSLLSSNARLGGASFAFQNSGVANAGMRKKFDLPPTQPLNA